MAVKVKELSGGGKSFRISKERAMKVTAITPSNFTKVCVASGILPEATLTEELPKGSFWARDASGEWVAVNDEGETPEFVAFESLGRRLTGEVYILDAETGEWEVM